MMSSLTTSVSVLMALKVLLLVAAGAAFVWWQLRDLALEKKRAEESQAKEQPPA